MNVVSRETFARELFGVWLYCGEDHTSENIENTLNRYGFQIILGDNRATAPFILRDDVEECNLATSEGIL